MDYYPAHQDILINFVKKNTQLFRMKGSLTMFTKLTQKREGGWANADIADKWWRGVKEMLTMADKGRTGGPDSHNFG